jgi:8-oxo-dGTP pyrophosphatase MutT (NUDIX family)
VARLTRNRRGKLRRARATSAGGVVVRRRDKGLEVVVGARRRERNGLTWVLPKGTPNPGESVEQTATREVSEETGLKVRIVEPIGSIEYFFVSDGTRIHKTVHFFLMEPTGGVLDDHDHEFVEVRWIPIADAQSLLTHDTERSMVSRAAGLALDDPAGLAEAAPTVAG